MLAGVQKPDLDSGGHKDALQDGGLDELGTGSDHKGDTHGLKLHKERWLAVIMQPGTPGRARV
ncbi:hypothetical protein JCM16814_03180 [Desulfobaculum senezii]